MTKKLTELPAATSVSASDVVAVVQGGVTKKATISQLPSGATPGGSVGQVQVHGEGGTLDGYTLFGAGNIQINIDPEAKEIEIDGSNIEGSPPGGSTGDLQIKNGDSFAPVRDEDDEPPAVGAVARFDGTKWVAAADVPEVPDGAAAGDFFYFDGNDFARLAPPASNGTYGIVWTGGVPTGWALAGEGTGGGGTFDPTTLAWKGFWRASYAGGAAWSGTASAGTSGSNSIDSAARPTAGTAVNGYTPATFNGTTQYLTSGGEVDWIAHDKYTFVALIRLNAYGAGGGSGSEFNWPAIFQDSGGNWGIFVDASGIGLYHNDTDAGTKAIRANVALSTWVLVHATWDGTNIKLYLNGVEAASMSAVNLNTAHADGEILNVGKSVGSSGFASFSMLEGRLGDFTMTPTQIGNDKTYCNTRYALSL